MKIAVVLRGISYNPTYRLGVDWRLGMDSFKANIINDCLDHGATIDIFIGTYNNAKSQEILESYKALEIADRVKVVECAFFPIGGPEYNQRDCCKKALQLLKQNGHLYDQIILTRFDLEYKKSISEMNIDNNKINILWKELEHAWKAHKRICDVFFVFNATYLPAFMIACERQRDRTNLHKIYNWLLTYVGQDSSQIHFLTGDNEFYDSNSDKYENPFYVVLRGCL